jgi:acyl-CoA synthetase (AMP-forming)/AMP-acid ligase II
MTSRWGEPLSEYANVVALLDERAAGRGDEQFCEFPDGERTYASLARRSRELAAGLSDAGIDTGDRVVVLMYNRPAFLDVYFAVARLGGVVVPVNVSLQGADLTYTLTDAEPSAVVVGPDCLDRYDDVRETVAADIGSTLDLALDPASGYDLLDDYYHDGDLTVPDPETGQSDPLVTIYTSGTTGMPKGVVLPHGALLTVGTELSERVIQPTDEDLLYMSQPLFHIFAQMVMVEALVAGVPFAMERWFSKSKFWDRVAEYGATVIHFSSAISDILYEETEAPDNPVRVGFGAIADDIQKPFGEQFDCQVVPLYGLTECGGLALCGTVDEPRSGSMGTPTRYAAVEIVDEDDQPVPDGEHGEIVVRPTRPNAMIARYYGKPERTVEELSNQWLHTGDIGYRDDDGRFHFVDRKSYFLRHKGENVSVHEVERILDSHPDVETAIVLGVDAEVGGEEVLAALRAVEGRDIDPLDVIEFCDGRMAYFKIPRYVVPVASFPRTETKGTVERHTLRDQLDGDWWDLQDTDYEVQR